MAERTILDLEATGTLNVAAVTNKTTVLSDLGVATVGTDAIWDVAGDLVVGTGANTAARLAKGAALDVLRVNAGATALEWAAPASTGAPTAATYITQTPHADLSAEQALSLLASGFMFVTTTTGAITSVPIPVPVASGGTGTINGSITGTAGLTFTATGSGNNITLTTTNGFVQIVGGFSASGYFELTEQAAPAAPANAGRMFFDTSNRFSWIGENGFVRTIDGTANSADRIYVLPDIAGTVVLTTTLNNSTLPGAFTTLSASGAVTLGTSLAFPVAVIPITGPTSMAFDTTIYGGGVSAALSRTALSGSSGFIVRSDFSYGFSSTTAANGSLDLLLTREAAATLQLGADGATGTNQKLKAMDASAGTGGNLTLAAGTGTTAGGALIFQTAATGTLTDRLTITAAGVATFSGGVSGLQFDAGNSGYIGFGAGRTIISSTGDGLLTVWNRNADNFNRETYGGTTSSFPALKRVGAELQVTHAATTAAINVAAVDAEMTFIEDRYRRKGSGSPEGVVTAPISAIYHRTDGGAVTSVYFKESGTGNTGWVAK